MVKENSREILARIDERLKNFMEISSKERKDIRVKLEELSKHVNDEMGKMDKRLRKLETRNSILSAYLKLFTAIITSSVVSTVILRIIGII